MGEMMGLLQYGTTGLIRAVKRVTRNAVSDKTVSVAGSISRTTPSADGWSWKPVEHHRGRHPLRGIDRRSPRSEYGPR